MAEAFEDISLVTKTQEDEERPSKFDPKGLPKMMILGNEMPVQPVSIIERLARADGETFEENEISISEQISTDTENGTSIPPSVLLTEVLRYELPHYLEKVLAPQSSCFSRLSTDKIMQWTNKLITKPLTKISPENNRLCIQLFKNLMSYMGDRLSSKEPVRHVLKHLKLTLYSHSSIKDEAYIQVLKQINNNPDVTKKMRGWKFLAILASSFAPSQELYYSMLNKLFFEIKNHEDYEVVKYANFIFARLYRSQISPRRLIPSAVEIEAIEVDRIK